VFETTAQLRWKISLQVLSSTTYCRPKTFGPRGTMAFYDNTLKPKKAGTVVLSRL
tara:strand:+ start:393 stop:557 length:165 start_codon:yes stop_codon:yes gene_type:complete